jgi:putative aldouronate transport system permease protein
MANDMALKRGKFGLKSFALSRKKDKDDEMESSRMVRSDGTKVGDIVFVAICVIISLVCLIPMINLLARSLSGTDFLVRREVYLLPKGLNIDAYSTVLGDPKYIKSFFWTVFLTVVCTFISLTMTVLCAYPLIFNKLKGRSFFNIVITITMFFNAGTIPNYLLMKELNLLDKIQEAMFEGRQLKSFHPHNYIQYPANRSHHYANHRMQQLPYPSYILSSFLFL